jgi:hypothetical protein
LPPWFRRMLGQRGHYQGSGIQKLKNFGAHRIGRISENLARDSLILTGQNFII